MEELGTEKFSDEKKLEKRTGFCDIAFGINGRDFWGEAKQCWPTLDGKNKTEMVDRNFKVATSQVRAGKERGYEGLAIVVIAPKIKVSHTNWRHIDDYVLHYLKQLQAIPNITLAWIFPGYTRRIRPNNDYWGIYYFPGVILALQPVKPKKF